MAIPVVSGIITGATHATVDAALNTVFGSSNRAGSYQGNENVPNLILSPDQIMDTWLRSNFEPTVQDRNFRNLLKYHGITLNPADRIVTPGTPRFMALSAEKNRVECAWWRQYLGNLQTPPPLELLIQLYQLGRLNEPTFTNWVLRYGYKEEYARKLLIEQPYIFDPEKSRILNAVELNELYSLYLRDIYTEEAYYQDRRDQIDDYRKKLAAAGMPDSTDQVAFEKLVQPPTYGECIELAQRDLLVGIGRTFNADGTPPLDKGTPAEQRNEFNRLMALEGFTDPKIIDYLYALRQRLPTEGELIEAAVKNAFVGPLAKILKLDDEYEEQPQFIVGTDRLGLSGSPFISQADMRTHINNHRLRAGNERNGVVLEVDENEDQANERADEYFHAQDGSLLTWAQVFWRSHWVNLSPSQIYECLHRHRPIDSTKPGAAQAQEEYEQRLGELTFDETANTVEARYALAVEYSARYGRNPGVPPVTQDIVDTVLRANDYAPLFRQNLSAISFNVLRLVDIRRIVQLSLKNEAFARSAIGYNPAIGNALPAAQNGGVQGVAVLPNALEKFVFAWARENFLDRGQTPDAAQSLATLAVRQGQTSNRVAIRRYTKILERAYRVGLITLAQMRIYLATPIQRPIRPEGEFVGFELDTGPEDIDVFGEADLAADLFDDTEALAYQSETTAELVAEDQLEDVDNIA